MPLKIQSAGTSILHQSINHWSVLQLWDVWHIFCVHLTWSQRRAGTLQTSSRVTSQLWLSLGVCAHKEAPVCLKLPKWVWVDWEKFTVLRRGQGAWFSPLKGLFAMMGNTIPLKYLMVLSPGQPRGNLSVALQREQVYSVRAAPMGTWGSWATPCFIALLCFACVLQEKARKLGENRGAGRSELSAACEMSPPKEQLRGRW